MKYRLRYVKREKNEFKKEWNWEFSLEDIKINLNI